MSFFEENNKNHDHSHSHGHGHGHFESLKNINRAFYIGIILNLLFTIIEFVVGYINNSLALLSDASHNLSDVASLIISLIGMKLAQKASNLTFTYGYRKASILASLINSILLISIIVNIFIEAFERLFSSPPILGSAIIFTALIGVVINTVSAFLFFKGQHDDINVKGAYLHLLLDALVSVAVVISGVIIHYTSWDIIDPIISFVIGIVIFISSWSLLKESLKLTLDGVPKEIDFAKAKALILKTEGVKDVHHIHIWALSSTENALTAHIRLINDHLSLAEQIIIKNELKHNLEHIKITHSTIEFESSNIECKDENC